jgi:hypothetical protein|tara:strand:+ start:1564 stop:1866 length:303 start_codon:yes stop_codon:yes gene_type:complete
MQGNPSRSLAGDASWISPETERFWPNSGQRCHMTLDLQMPVICGPGLCVTSMMWFSVMCYGVAIAVTAGFDIDPGHSHMAFSTTYTFQNPMHVTSNVPAL